MMITGGKKYSKVYFHSNKEDSLDRKIQKLWVNFLAFKVIPTPYLNYSFLSYYQHQPLDMQVDVHYPVMMKFKNKQTNPEN